MLCNFIPLLYFNFIMANKDEKIIEANPTLTPYQLLEKGLSQAKYNELTEANYQPTAAPTTPAPAATATAEKIAPPEKIVPQVTKPQQPQPKQQPARQQKQQPVVTKAANPKLSPPRPYIPQQPQNADVPMAVLINKKTGKRTRMTRAAALLAQRMDKGSFDVR